MSTYERRLTLDSTPRLVAASHVRIHSLAALFKTKSVCQKLLVEQGMKKI